MTRLFDHEKLKVYQEAIGFAAWVDGLLAQLPKVSAVRNQLDRASTSIALNIAEGNGKFGSRDRCRFLDIARGSALECAACLDILVAKKLVADGSVEEGRRQLNAIVAMLMGLIKSVSGRGVAEELTEYDAEGCRAACDPHGCEREGKREREEEQEREREEEQE